ncbi:MAG: lysine--tRNA ligase [bacterium]|nr:lysine--tRNA ligase [bacterium]
MATIDELRAVRLKKLEAIQKAGILAYPSETKRTHKIEEALGDFAELSKQAKEIILVGRIKSQRGHGGVTFLDIEDGSGKIQVFLKKDGVGEKSYQFFLDNFDIGDFIEARGTLFETKAGEKTLATADYKMLAKSLLPLPEKWHGLQDVEERFRKRYLDLIMNPAVKEKFILRSNIIKELRSFMEKEGFIEVETPVLQPIYGGTEAKPFKTHLNALDMDLYLRIAPELYLKRLLVGGFEKVFEIGRCFRNEGVDRSHNPDFSEMEFYWAYADYKDMMKLIEKMLSSLVKNLFKGLKIRYEEQEIDFKPPFEKVEYQTLIRNLTKIDIETISKDALFLKAVELEVNVDRKMTKFQLTDAVYKKFCLPKICQPTFIIHHPEGSFPLAKQTDDNPKKMGSIQLVIAGLEIVKAYSELNDPLRQADNFKEQEKLFVEGVQDAQRMDKDYIEALEYGMPPAAGFGMGIDRLVALLTDSHTLREIILFPTMRSKS